MRSDMGRSWSMRRGCKLIAAGPFESRDKDAMSRAKRKSGGRKPQSAGAVSNHGDAQHSEIERLIERRRFKDAFKLAKLCFRGDSGTENRRLLERTYVLRIQDLAQGGMPTAAAEVAERLLELGVTDAGVLEQLVLLLPCIGLGRRASALSARLESPEAHSRLTLKLADRAVLHPDQTPTDRPELCNGALQIRAALAAIESGDEAVANERLQTIPRSSPFADWRLFVRGWAAFRRGESQSARDNWNRLDPERFALRIAQVLERSEAAKAAAAPSIDLSTLELSVFGEPVLSRLERLRKALDEADWKQVLQTIRALRPALKKVDRSLAERLTTVLTDPLFNHAVDLRPRDAERLIQSFTEAAEPLHFDPQWHRFWALYWEGPENEPARAEERWRQYAAGLEVDAALSPDERRRLQAAVWQHLAEMLFEQDQPDSSDDDWGRPDLGLVDDERRRQITACLDRSLQLDSSLRVAHEFALHVYDAWDMPQEELAAAERMLAAFPDDVETLTTLVELHERREEPEAVLARLARLRDLKPLDESLGHSEYWARATLARHHALAGRWDAGRAEFERVLTSEIGPFREFEVRVRQAAFEYKAVRTAAAQVFVDRAAALQEDQATLWLALSVEAGRYQLPKSITAHYQELLDAALRKKVNSRTAGSLSQLIGAYLMGGVEYPGFERHCKQVADYLSRTTRIKCQEADLLKACAFLQAYGEEDVRQLWEKLARKGLKLFPRSPAFISIGVAADMHKSPLYVDIVHARKQLGRALDLLKASDSPLDRGLKRQIKHQLTALDNLAELRARFPFSSMPGGRGAPRTMFEMIDMFRAIEDQINGAGEEDEDNSDSDDFRPLFDMPPEGGAPGAPSPSKSSARPKKKKK